MAEADIRYAILWTPLKDVDAECRKRGMKDGDGTSYWDWIEPEHCTRKQPVQGGFNTAASFARSVAESDVFGTARIEREVLVSDHDDLGNVFDNQTWGADAVWEVGPDDEPVITCAA